MSSYDVLVVGYGPVGAVAAASLGRLGVRTLVVERAPAPFPLPRAVAADDEVLQILQGLPGCADLPAEMVAGERVHLTGRHDQPLLTVDFGTTSLGLPGYAFFDQPALEQRLRASVAGLPSVEVRLGCGLARWEQDRDRVTAVLDDGAQVRASYLLACDGAGSEIRTALGIGTTGSTFAERWLVVDAVGARPPTMPEFTFLCRPARPSVSVPTPAGHRREWLLDPGKAPAPEGLLAEHVDPASVDVVRAAVYTFHARVADRWRAGRVFLLGDAAHFMPPFAGQGLGAGVRDADNLAWKLAAVLAGDAGEPLLDSYERERRAHVRRMIWLSLFLGGIVGTRSPAAAAVRDGLLRGLGAAPGVGRWLRAGGPKPPPGLVPSTVDLLVPRRGSRGGRLLPRPDAGWAVLGIGIEPAGTAVDYWRARGAVVRRVGALPVGRPGEIVLVRPDRHVLAVLRPAELAAATAAYRDRSSPPSTGIAAPVTYEVAGLSRKAATRPSSAGSP